jgi:hypothetical protein
MMSPSGDGYIDVTISSFANTFRRIEFSEESLTGIYVLRDEGFDLSVPIYVGQSENVPYRVTQHATGAALRPRIKFTHYDFYSCSRTDLLNLEKRMIAHLNPLLNKAHGQAGGSHHWKMDEEFCESLCKYMIYAKIPLSFLSQHRATQVIFHVTKTRHFYSRVLKTLGHNESHA